MILLIPINKPRKYKSFFFFEENKIKIKKFSKNFRALLSGSVLAVATIVISLTQSGCGPDDKPTTTPTTVTPTVIEEYLILDGKRYEGKDFYKKVFANGNSDSYLNIQIGPNYPLIEITHEREEKSDTMVARIYSPAQGQSSSDIFGWEVYFFGAYGTQPLNCYFGSIDKPAIPHGKYELKKINGKYVSTFGKIQMVCGKGGGTEGSIMVTEGQVIWENKN